MNTRNGRDGGPAQWGATVALIVFVVLAAAGHKEIGAMLHVILTVIEIAVFTVAGAAVLAAAVVIVKARRRAVRRRPHRVPVTAHSIRIRPADIARPALYEPHRRPAPWPLPGQWREITPSNDHRKEN